MAAIPGRRQPTINDLRVKMCYICREEEAHDQPASPPRRWVHPCKCTLIAHESCLLEWIRTAEQNPRKKEDQVLKCPQCGSKYEMISEQTRMLRALERGNRLLSIGGRVVTICTIGSFVVAFGSGVYILLTSFGALSLRHFVGEEMYQYLLTDDPTNWPVMAWFDLPLIPISLVLGRSALSGLVSYNHAFMIWPMVLPRTQLAPTSNAFTRLLTKALLDFDSLEPSFGAVFFSWPPSPLMYTIGFGVVKGLYTRYYRLLRRRILGESATKEEQERNARGGVRQLLIENWQMEVRVDQEFVNEDGEPVPPPADNGARGRERQRNVAVQEANIEPIGPPVQEEAPAPVPAEEGPVPAVDIAPAVEQGANVQPEPRPQDAPAVAAPVQPPAAAPAADDEENPNMRPRNANVRITGSLLGRVIGGGLMVPYISSRIGNLLLSLSRYSPILRRFLGVRPQGNAAMVAALGMRAYDRVFDELKDPHTSVARSTWLALKFGMCFAGAGSAVWRKADPVWWRSTLGLGIFVVTRDAISLYYQWLSQREIRSRTLKDRSFEGIDPAELDLIPDRRAEIA